MGKAHESGAVGLMEVAEQLGGSVGVWRKLCLEKRIPFFREGKRYFLHPKDVLAIVRKDAIKVHGLKEEPTEVDLAVEQIRANVLRKASTAAIEAMKEEIENASVGEVPPPLLAALHRELANMLEAHAES